MTLGRPPEEARTGMAARDPEDYTPDDFRNKGLVIRRFKKDIKKQVSSDF